MPYSCRAASRSCIPSSSTQKIKADHVIHLPQKLHLDQMLDCFLGFYFFGYTWFIEIRGAMIYRWNGDKGANGNGDDLVIWCPIIGFVTWVTLFWRGLLKNLAPWMFCPVLLTKFGALSCLGHTIKLLLFYLASDTHFGAFKASWRIVSRKRKRLYSWINTLYLCTEDPGSVLKSCILWSLL